MKTATLITALCTFISVNAFATPHAETVVSFNAAALEAPENIFIDLSGNKYITMSLTGEVRKVASNGHQSTLTNIPLGAPPLTPCSPELPLPIPVLLGIDMDIFGNFYFANKSCNPAETGVWKFKSNGELVQLTTFPNGTVPNGIAYVAGNIYVADTFGGKVWKVPALGGAPTVWIENTLLAPRVGAVFPGANGLKYFRGEIYVSVSDKANIIAIPLRLNGTAGTPRIHATIGAPGGPGCDDFAFDILGNLYCGSDPFNTILKITPSGTVTTLLTAADGLDGPTAVFFGRGSESNMIYITNGAFPFFSTTHNPSLMRFDVGIPGSILR